MHNVHICLIGAVGSSIVRGSLSPSMFSAYTLNQ